MPILKTPAVILRRVNHSETSLICTFYTREYGRLSAIAKGARRQKSQFAGILDLMSYLDIVVYTKETREVQTLSSAEYIRPFLNIRKEMERTGLGLSMVETIRQAIIGEEPNPQVFDMFIACLETINDDPGTDIEILWWFHIHLAILLGFEPDFKHCFECGKSLAHGYFTSDTGQIHCQNCIIQQPGMIKLNNLEIRLLGYLTDTFLEDLESQAIHRTLRGTEGKDEPREQVSPDIITNTIVQYLRYHVEGITTLQSLRFFTTLK